MRRLSLLALSLLAPLLTMEVAHAQTVGRTAGQFAVSPSGSATYAIPIWAPPGPNHLQPNIALTYDSGAGNGPIGVGWSVSGLSQIYRCNRTVAQDGAASSVNLTTSDALCLDGQRLQLTGGNQGTAGSTYQTEIANFENVAAYSSAGNGPGYFVVQAPNGTQYEYGNPITTASAQVLATGTTTASTWMLDKVTDTAGNTMLITYTTATGTAVPNSIAWTPIISGSSTYQYAMQFNYGTNAPQSSVYGYVAGTAVTNTQLLQSVAITNTPSGGGTSTVKQYNLGYSTSPVTSREELTSVTECADSTTNHCLSPTYFTYQNATFGISTTATTAVTLAPFSARPVLNYDFNGDGIPDILYNNGTNWYVALGTPTGYSAGINTEIPASMVISQNMIVGDVLGTHHDGILAQNGSTWYYYTLNGSAFSGVPTGLGVDTTAANFALVDVNGDGLPDLVSGYTYVSSSNPAHLTTRLNNSSGGTVSFESPVAAFTDTSGITTTAMYSPDSFSGGLRSWDFNGDGRQDLFFYGINVVCNPTCTETLVADELLGQSNGTFTAAPLPFTYSVSYTANSLQFLNWNNDKCTDITWGTQVYVSACNGTIGSTLNLSGTLVTAMDVDGDGRKDAIINNGGTLAVQISTGVGVEPAVTLGIPYDSSADYGRLDVGGTGLDELEIYSTTQGNVNYFARNSPGTIPDVLTSATDGFANSATPTYFSITQGANNHYSVTSTTPPESVDAAFTSPLYIVGTATFSDPSTPGATYTQNHYYTNAWQNLQGRGFLGFTTHEIIDSRNSVAETQTYNMVFPTTGLLVGDVSVQNSGSGATIANLTVTPAATTLNSVTGAQRFFPYIANISQDQYEVGGTKNGQQITTAVVSYTYDNYGNATNITSTVTDTDSTVPKSPLYNQFWTTSTTNTPQADTTHWCLNLMSGIQTVYTVNGSSAVTRTKQMTPDTAHCRYTQMVTEPSSSTYEVSEQLGYDNFGNINSDAVTGIGMATRTTGITWNTTGQFPATVTNALGLGQTTTLAFDPVWGKKTSVTDPNGLVTSWLYDDFGRKTQVMRPDGTYTNSAYSDMTGIGYNFHGLAVEQLTYSSAGTFTRGDDSLYDSAGRPVGQVDENIAGGYNQTSVMYDSLGRVVSRSAPCAWSGWPTVCPFFTQASYDILNRPIQIQQPSSANNGTAATTSYTYAGRTITVTDPNYHANTTITDVNGWLREVLDANGYEVTTSYDAAGGKTGIVDNQNRTLWTGTVQYGIAPFTVTATDSALGSQTNTFDALGELTCWTNARYTSPCSFSATYDSLSRPVTRTEPDLFTQWTWGSTAASDNIGKLASVCTGPGTNTSDPPSCTSSGYSESEGYDADGRLSQRSIVIPTVGTTTGGTYNYGFGYNPSGQLGTLTYPTTIGTPLQLQYNYSNGILQSIMDAAPDAVTLWTADANNPAGQTTQETLGNGVVINRSFDSVALWLNSITAGLNGGTTLESQNYAHDAVGNVTQRLENNLSLTESFYYDNLNRLYYSSLISQIAGTTTTNLQMCYDNIGGSCTENLPGPGSITGKTADAAAPSSYTATWTSYNYPSQITTASESVQFSYGPDRMRWQQNYNNGVEVTNYIGRNLEQVATSSGTTYRQYVYAGTEPVAVLSPSSSGNTITYMLSDQEGSLAALLNSGGTSDVSESFTAYGARRNPASWSGAPATGDLTTIAGLTRQGYTFQTALGQAMGFNHMNGRVQDAVTGQFMSPDPNIPDPTNTQDYNRYAYVRNNPMTFLDPSGFIPCMSAGEIAAQRAIDALINAVMSVLTDLSQQGNDQDSTSETGQQVGVTITALACITPIVSPYSSTSSPGGSGYPGNGNASNGSASSSGGAGQAAAPPQTTQPKPNTSCSSLSSFGCQVCVNTYLNNTYGNFGGFVASTFNAQQAIPGISGNSALDTLATDGELGALKQGVPWALRTAGNAIAMASKTPGPFWAGGLTETVGVLASDTLFAVGAMTTPFASMALHIARSNCGG